MLTIGLFIMSLFLNGLVEIIWNWSLKETREIIELKHIDELVQLALAFGNLKLEINSTIFLCHTYQVTL